MYVVSQRFSHSLDNQISDLDFVDTFLDMDHLKHSFPDHIVNVSIFFFYLTKKFQVYYIL